MLIPEEGDPSSTTDHLFRLHKIQTFPFLILLLRPFFVKKGIENPESHVVRLPMDLNQGTYL